MLLALSMMLDGTTSPAPSGGPSPPRPDALLQHTFAGDRTPPPAAVLPLSGTQALSSPIHHMQVRTLSCPEQAFTAAFL